MKQSNERHPSVAYKTNKDVRFEIRHEHSDEDKIRLLLSASRMSPSKIPWQQLLSWKEARRISSTAS